MHRRFQRLALTIARPSPGKITRNVNTSALKISSLSLGVLAELSLDYLSRKSWIINSALRSSLTLEKHRLYAPYVRTYVAFHRLFFSLVSPTLILLLSSLEMRARENVDTHATFAWECVHTVERHPRVHRVRVALVILVLVEVVRGR